MDLRVRFELLLSIYVYFLRHRYPTGLEYKSVCLELVRKYPVLCDKNAKNPVVCRMQLRLLHCAAVLWTNDEVTRFLFL